MEKNIILSVDDSEFIRRKLKNIILSAGFEFHGAENGIEALFILDKIYENVSLILLDCEMPQMNGYDFLVKIKKDVNLKKIPVIMLSGETNSQNIVRVIKAGAVEYITKPFNEDFLKENIENYALNKH